MAEQVLTAVRTAPGTTELRELARPDGVVVVPRERADRVLDASRARAAREARLRERLGRKGLTYVDDQEPRA